MRNVRFNAFDIGVVDSDILYVTSNDGLFIDESIVPYDQILILEEVSKDSQKLIKMDTNPKKDNQNGFRPSVIL
jgi:hypothetical protein